MTVSNTVSPEEENRIRSYLELESQALCRIDVIQIRRALCLLWDVFENSGSVYVFGNGGSAATASHFAQDLNRLACRTFCLSDNTPFLTALSNDVSFEDAYRLQLSGRLTKKDLVVAISVSGQSQNILRAAAYAKAAGVPVIGLTGYEGGSLETLCDCHICTNLHDMQMSEDLHLAVCHVLTVQLRERMKENICGKAENR